MQLKWAELDAMFGLDRDKIEVDLVKLDADNENKALDRRFNGMNAQQVQQTEEDDSVNDLVEGLLQTASEINQSSAKIAEAARLIAAPKRVVRDKKGELVGVEVVDGLG